MRVHQLVRHPVRASQSFKLAQFLSLMLEVSAPLMNDDAGIVVWAYIHRSN